jgi:phospholipid transport system substrate-binding protein
MKSSTRCRELRGAFALAGALLLAGLTHPAAAGPTPREVVQGTSDQVLAVLAEKDLSKEARRDKVRAIVLRSVDFETLSRLVLARNWSRFSPGQQQEFMQAFQDHLAATYGKRLDDYRNEKVAIVGDRQEANGDWTVKSRILRGGGSNDIEVDYRLRQTNGQWKVIDFIIEQVSMVANFRSQFQDIVASGGPEKLLQLLKEKTATGGEFKSRDPEGGPRGDRQPGGDGLCARMPADHAPRFQRAIVHTSRGLSASLRTTEGSKPECMKQFWQRGSWRDSQ